MLVTLNSPIRQCNRCVSYGYTLDWTADINAEDYLVEIATDSGFSNIVDSVNNTNNKFH